MKEFTIVERTEPFTLDEVFDFIDDTNIGKTDAHELKSRIADMVQAERNKAIDEFAEKLNTDVESFVAEVDGVRADLLTLDYFSEFVFEVAERLKGAEENG